MKQPTIAACLEIIRQYVACENYAQVCDVTCTLPQTIEKLVRAEQRRVNIATLKEDARETAAWIQNQRR